MTYYTHIHKHASKSMDLAIIFANNSIFLANETAKAIVLMNRAIFILSTTVKLGIRQLRLGIENL